MNKSYQNILNLETNLPSDISAFIKTKTFPYKTSLILISEVSFSSGKISKLIFYYNNGLNLKNSSKPLFDLCLLCSVDFFLILYIISL